MSVHNKFLLFGGSLKDHFYDPTTVFGCVCLIVGASYLLRWVWNWFRTKRVRGHNLKKQPPTPKFAQHSWYNSDFLDRPSYCNLCEELFTHGSTCEVCGARVHSKCRKKFQQTCKYSSFSPPSTPSSYNNLKNTTTPQHQWMKGNLPLTSLCFACKESCGNEPKLADYRCVWCQRTVHEACMRDLLPTCDFGKYRNMILPPSSVAINPKLWQITSNWTEDTSPLLIFVHPRSGGNEGTQLFRTFKQLLNPIQICDVSRKGPRPLFEMAKDILPRCRLLVCGGDGTVGWVLSTLDNLNLPCPPPTAIIPLGTGNDLSRCLGWGSGYDGEGEEFFDELLAAVEHSKPVLLDRWKVVVTPQRGRLGKLFSKTASKELILNNYMSIGVDAQITWHFHSNRNLYPSWFASRFINKCWYGIFGAKEFLIEQSCRELPSYMDIELDGIRLDISGLQGVIVLNINSYAGGVDVWGKSTSDVYPPPRIDDQMFEVVGLTSSLHIGQVIVGVSECKRLGQGRQLKIVWKGRDEKSDDENKTIKTPTVPIQIDGEPWLQTPATITLSFYKQIPMIKKLT